MKTKISLSSCCLLLLLGSGAFAQTPDGETPAAETVCDGLNGAAWGLCNAFCEAMDCHLGSVPGCERVRQSYTKITGNATFPCEGPPTCPCFTRDDLRASAEEFKKIYQFTQNFNFRFCGFGVSVTTGDSYRANIFSSNNFCNQFVAGDTSPPQISISLEEAQACYLIIDEECNLL